MCGRYNLMASATDIATLLQTPVVGRAVTLPLFEVRPTDEIPIAVESATIPGRRLEAARWNLARPWQKDTRSKKSAPLINVRSETATEKFPWAIQRHRCLIPATGYWEWTGPRDQRQRYFLRLPDAPVFAMAGVYSWWCDRQKAEDDPHRWILTAAIMTTAADSRLGKIHSRTPLLLPAAAWPRWIDPAIVADHDFVTAAVDDHARMIGDIEYLPVKRTGKYEELVTPAS